MRIDLYHLYRYADYNRLVYPIILDVLKVWSESFGWNARVSVCREGRVKLDTRADVVGISVYTQTAPAAFRLGDKLRQKGKIVIFGGPHFRGPQTFKEASQHCDILAGSISEGQWLDLLRDISTGVIPPGGPGTTFVQDRENLFRYPDNFYEAFKSQSRFQLPSVPTSIGCPYDCSFCSPYRQGQYILRDMESIVNEVARIKGKMVFLCDATFGLNKKFAVELMKKLAPLEKKIAIETTLERLRDREFMDALALGGVKRIMVGIETLGLKLRKHGGEDLEERVKRVTGYARERRMPIQGNIICGLDCDGPDIFDKIFHFHQWSGLDSILVNLLTPYPNTRLYHQFIREGRIIDFNWEHYDYHHLVFRPLRMTEDQLIDGYIQLYKALTRQKPFLMDLFSTYAKNGLRVESTAYILNNLYNRYNFRREEKKLRKNQRHIELNLRKEMPGKPVPAQEII